MKSLKGIQNYIIAWAIVVVAIAAIMITASPKLQNSGKQEAKNRVTEVPKIISKVKDLEVISTTIKRQGEPSAVVAIEIRNNSEKPIIAIAIESGNDKDASGVSTDGFKEGDEPPSVILPPHGSIIMEMAVDNLMPGKPLKIAGVMYADGSDEGDELTRKTLRGHREQAKTKGSARKGEP